MANIKEVEWVFFTCLVHRRKINELQVRCNIFHTVNESYWDNRIRFGINYNYLRLQHTANHSGQLWRLTVPISSSAIILPRKTFWTLCFSVCCEDCCPSWRANNSLRVWLTLHNPNVLFYCYSFSFLSPLPSQPATLPLMGFALTVNSFTISF